MKTNNILRTAIATSILSLSNAAFAETVDVPFSGTVPEDCSIEILVEGVLSPTTTLYPGRLTGSAQYGATGRMAEIEVICVGDGLLTMDDPVDNGSTVQLPGQEVADLRDYNSDAALIASPSNPALQGSVPASMTHTGTVQYKMRMYDSTVNGSPVPDGTYNYVVPVTITPN